MFQVPRTRSQPYQPCPQSPQAGPTLLTDFLLVTHRAQFPSPHWLTPHPISTAGDQPLASVPPQPYLQDLSPAF